jgi:hypothetical protein
MSLYMFGFQCDVFVDTSYRQIPKNNWLNEYRKRLPANYVDRKLIIFTTYDNLSNQHSLYPIFLEEKKNINVLALE